VGGEQHDAIARQLAEQVPEPHPLLGIQPGGGLVHDEDTRVVEQRLRDAHALAHAAGETAERPIPRFAQVHELEQLERALARRAWLQALRGGDVVHELECRELRVDAEVLGQVAERLAQRVGLAREIAPLPTARVRRSGA
jgi:hypothetical protein